MIKLTDINTSFASCASGSPSFKYFAEVRCFAYDDVSFLAEVHGYEEE